MAENSYLKLYIGPMFSGKSTHLLTEINKYKHITSNIIVINHILDKKRHLELEKSDGYLKTHDNKIFPAIMLNNLSEIYINESFSSKYKTADIIIIDEGQFYPDIFEFLKYELKLQRKKTFIVAGLSGDSNMCPIGDILKLVPLADEIYKLTAYCIYCKDATLASFTMKESKDKTQITIGNAELYSPVCRKHHKIYPYF
jgi:thymidine kinase